jgi:hypothetical protein
MKCFSMILSLALFIPACDEVDQDGKGGIYQGGSELAADLRLCAEEKSDQDVVDCARSSLAAADDLASRGLLASPQKCEINGKRCPPLDTNDDHLEN